MSCFLFCFFTEKWNRFGATNMSCTLSLISPYSEVFLFMLNPVILQFFATTSLLGFNRDQDIVVLEKVQLHSKDLLHQRADNLNRWDRLRMAGHRKGTEW